MNVAPSTTQLVHGDFIAECSRHLQEGTVDVVVTSPPYNLGIAYNRYRDKMPKEEYLDWTERWAREVKRVLSPGGSLFLNLGCRPSDPGAPWEVVSVVRRFFELQNVIHWIKSITIEKGDVGNYPGITQDVTVGHYKPVNSDRFVNNCAEYVFHLTHTGRVKIARLALGVPYQDSSNVGRWAKAGGGVHCRGNTWFIPYPTIQRRAGDRPHPATFPPKLPEMCMRLHGVEQIRLAMDPFMGLGSTGLAARALGKPFIGFEIDEQYLAYAKRRIGEAGQNEPENARAARDQASSEENSLEPDRRLIV